MKRVFLATSALLLLCAAGPVNEIAPRWSAGDIAVLQRWVSLASLDALPPPSSAALDHALAGGDQAKVDEAATELALNLARMHLLGGSPRKRWNVRDTDQAIDIKGELESSLAVHTLDAFYASLLPRDPEYGMLRAAYARATDPAARKTIALNMERWRWMPRSLGEDHVLVNTAAFEAGLWRAGKRTGTWRVIVGKKSTPTPVFDATITGVTFNPWWEVPASIVRESVGGLVRRSPATARARGYVWSGGRYRQRPGPGNALGQMKLVMPNAYTVYMHDTPNRNLFDQEVRAFSHGCIRTGDALGYAAALLEGMATRPQIDAIVASGETATVYLGRPMPVYVAYFTAVGDGAGGARILPDIYSRDK